MRHPNRRYGNPSELQYYASFYGDKKTYLKNLADALRRDERTVRDWLSEARPVPWWVPELLRLRDLERRETMRQMSTPARRLAVVTHAGQLELRRETDLILAQLDREKNKKPQALTDLRLDDFQRPRRAISSAS